MQQTTEIKGILEWLDVEQVALGVEHIEAAGDAFIAGQSRESFIILKHIDLPAQRFHTLAGFVAVKLRVLR